VSAHRCCRRETLNQAGLSVVDLGNGNLAGADLTQANLSGASLNGAHLRGARFQGASLRGAKLEGATEAALAGAERGEPQPKDAASSAPVKAQRPHRPQATATEPGEPPGPKEATKPRSGCLGAAVLFGILVIALISVGVFV
jgi:hypothetical protein